MPSWPNLMGRGASMGRQRSWMDGSFVPAKRGGAGIGLTGKGKGVRVMLVTDAAGVPLGLLTAGANVGEVRLAEATLATIHVPRPRGRLRTRPDQLIADRGLRRSAAAAAPPSPRHSALHPASATPRHLAACPWPAPEHV